MAGIGKARHGASGSHFLREAVLVFAGALIGAGLRVVVVDFLNFSSPGFYGWNWIYLFINTAGAFAFGFLVALFRFRFPSMQSKWYAFFLKGATASFTAFDLVFSQIYLITLQPEVWILILYVGVNFAACITCSALGIWLGSGKKPAKGRSRVPSHSPEAGRQGKRAASARHGY